MAMKPAIEKMRAELQGPLHAINENARWYHIKRGNPEAVKQALSALVEKVRQFVPEHPSITRGRMTAVEARTSATPFREEHPLPSDEDIAAANTEELEALTHRFGQGFILPRVLQMLLGENGHVGVFMSSAFSAATVRIETDPKAQPFIVTKLGVHKLSDFRKELAKAAFDQGHPWRDVAEKLGLHRAKNPVKHFDRTTTSGPLPLGDALAYHHMGVACLRQNELARALEWFTHSTHIAPQFLANHQHMLYTYLDPRTGPALRRELEDWIQHDPEDTLAGLHLTTMELITGNVDAADHHTRHFLQIDPSFASRILTHASALHEAGTAIADTSESREKGRKKRDEGR